MASRPMTVAEVAALERVIIRVHKALPTIELAIRMAGKKVPPFAESVEKAREVAAFGMTAEDARKIVKATDTEEERDRVRKWTNALASKEDAEILNRAILRMAKEALAEPDAPPAPPPADARDAIPASAIQIIGQHRLNPAKARIASVMHSAKIARGLVTVKHDPLTGWPVGQKEDGCNSGFVIVWQEGGGFVGGWFDHGRAPSQSVKTLKNVTNGYVDKRKPASGAPVWFYKISTDGKYRTTICAGGKWP